jgi:hypothetical protein
MNERVAIALLILIGIVVMANLAMFVMVRGATHGDPRRMNTFHISLNKPFEYKDKSMDELRKKMEELGDKGKDSPQDTPK